MSEKCEWVAAKAKGAGNLSSSSSEGDEAAPSLLLFRRPEGVFVFKVLAGTNPSSGRLLVRPLGPEEKERFLSSSGRPKGETGGGQEADRQGRHSQ